MSALSLNPNVACSTWKAVVLDRLPWLHDEMHCSGCGMKVLLVRQLGAGILDEIICSTCAAGSSIGSYNRGL